MRPLGTLALCAAVLLGCAEPEPARQGAPTAPQPRVFQTVDGKRFATEAERSAYLQNTDEARRERALIALERTRQERLATDLGALQRQRHGLRADAALRAADAAEREAAQIRRRTRAADVDPAEVDAAERREAEARRTEKLARRQAETRPVPVGREPWRRLLRYRRAGEPLADFRRRVVSAIGRARRDGGTVGDYL